MTGKFALRLFNLNATGETYTEITKMRVCNRNQTHDDEMRANHHHHFSFFPLLTSKNNLYRFFSHTNETQTEKSKTTQKTFTSPNRKGENLPISPPSNCRASKVAWELPPPLTPSSGPTGRTGHRPNRNHTRQAVHVSGPARKHER